MPLLWSHLVGPKLLALEEQSCNMAVWLARPLTPLEPKLPRRFSLGTSQIRPDTGWPLMANRTQAVAFSGLLVFVCKEIKCLPSRTAWKMKGHR